MFFVTRTDVWAVVKEAGTELERRAAVAGTHILPNKEVPRTVPIW